MNKIRTIGDDFAKVKERILTAVLDDYIKQDNPDYSDLDNEQPISIHIHVSLGDLRKVRAMVPR